MKRRVNARFATLIRLFERAEQSARYHKSEAEVDLLVGRLKALWADYRRLTARRKALRAQIEAIGAELKEDGELPQLDHLKGITLFNLARLVGQTGPLEDFRSGRALLRYAGLNLRERQSGTYRGQTRLSKKGRPLLRKILGQRVSPGPPEGPPLRPLLPPEAPRGHDRGEGQGGCNAQVSPHASQPGPKRRGLRPRAFWDL